MAENKNESQNLSNINEKLITALSSYRNVFSDIASEDGFLIIWLLLMLR
jgi:hypothetical protein